MPTLLLRLAAPMQSWGVESNFEIRRTEGFPTKSGVIGMIAAALGRSRNESLDDLNKLNFGIRVDREGQIIEDFQIAKGKAEKDTYLTRRNYLSDAVFLVGLESENSDFLKGIEDALKHPVYPLFLGRRSCPPTMPLLIGIRDGDLLTSLKCEPWLLEEWRQEKIYDDSERQLRIIVDCNGENGGAVIRDVPLSFSPIHRKFGWRYIKDCGYITVEKIKATPHKDCCADAKSDFSSDCTMTTQEYLRISRRNGAI
jgi:CRISPR system Cascade subunit CasD